MAEGGGLNERFGESASRSVKSGSSSQKTRWFCLTSQAKLGTARASAPWPAKTTVTWPSQRQSAHPSFARAWNHPTLLILVKAWSSDVVAVPPVHPISESFSGMGMVSLLPLFVELTHELAQ